MSLFPGWECSLLHIPEMPVTAHMHTPTPIWSSLEPLEEQLKKDPSRGWLVGRSLDALVLGEGGGTGWELLTKLLDSSKGRKPTLILRTQLSVRVNAILGECPRELGSSSPSHSPAGSLSFMSVWDLRPGHNGNRICSSSSFLA